MIPLLHTRFDRLALPLGVLGIAAAALFNQRLWQKDKRFLVEKTAPDQIPGLGSWPTLPLVSVLVAAWNEEEDIEHHIESFLALRYPHKELMLCAGGNDRTWELASRYDDPHVTLLRQQPGEGKQRSLARSLLQTRGDIIFLTDADCRLTDEVFERTVWPLVSGSEHIVSGTSRPFDKQVEHFFTFSQAATQLYSSWHTPAYAPGILGRNCAVDREVLARSGALDVPAAFGTDYVLAKTLAAAGERIRQEPRSLMPTRYPNTALSYVRQQRRWLRNVAVHGRYFDAREEMGASLRTSLLGLTMLVLPLAGLLITPWLIVPWVVLLAKALFARLRYLYFGGRLLKRPPRLVDALCQAPLLLLDFAAWSSPLLDYARRRQRWEW